MPDDPRRIYWDACVFLSFLNGEEERSDVIQQLLDEARDGEFELVTSTLSVAEVAFGKEEQDGRAPAPAILAAIEAFWLPGGPVNLIEFHRLIALDARDLVRDARLSRDERLTPLDAVHVASAKRLNAEEFHTYDGPLLRFKGSIPFSIREPWTQKPRITGWKEGDQLDALFRQSLLARQHDQIGGVGGPVRDADDREDAGVGDAEDHR